jgi:hypothetical protein
MVNGVSLDEKIYGDPSRKVWGLALTQSDKQDKEMTEGWRDDTNGVLVFVRTFVCMFESSIGL